MLRFQSKEQIFVGFKGWDIFGKFVQSVDICAHSLYPKALRISLHRSYSVLHCPLSRSYGNVLVSNFVHRCKIVRFCFKTNARLSQLRITLKCRNELCRGCRSSRKSNLRCFSTHSPASTACTLTRSLGASTTASAREAPPGEEGPLRQDPTLALGKLPLVGDRDPGPVRQPPT